MIPSIALFPTCIWLFVVYNKLKDYMFYFPIAVITIVNERPVKVSLAVLAVEPWINDMKQMFLTTNATSGEVNRDTSKKTEDGRQNAPYIKNTNSSMLLNGY